MVFGIPSTFGEEISAFTLATPFLLAIRNVPITAAPATPTKATNKLRREISRFLSIGHSDTQSKIAKPFATKRFA